MAAKHLVVLLAGALLLAGGAAAKDRLAPFQIDPPEGFFRMPKRQQKSPR